MEITFGQRLGYFKDSIMFLETCMLVFRRLALAFRHCSQAQWPGAVLLDALSALASCHGRLAALSASVFSCCHEKK